MRRIFVDALFWIAITNRRDQWHQAALTASRGLVNYHLITTEEVLTEVLNAFCEAGPIFRREAISLARDLLSDSRYTVIPQSHQTFLAGLALFEARLDKQYSLTDCIAMVTMRQESITEVLTSDRHFVQEGFTKLLKTLRVRELKNGRAGAGTLSSEADPALRSRRYFTGRRPQTAPVIAAIPVLMLDPGSGK